MIEENKARADLSPCEQGHILITCVSECHFDTIDQAIKALHPNASRAARTRLRAVAHVVDALDGVLMWPPKPIPSARFCASMPPCAPISPTSP